MEHKQNCFEVFLVLICAYITQNAAAADLCRTCKQTEKTARFLFNCDAEMLQNSFKTIFSKHTGEPLYVMMTGAGLQS